MFVIKVSATMVSTVEYILVCVHKILSPPGHLLGWRWKNHVWGIKTASASWTAPIVAEI